MISLSVESQMFGTSASCYVRIPFIISGDPSIHNEVILQMRYDDGFIAYLNGVEVTHAGFSGDAMWDSQADKEHNASAVTMNYFDISAFSDQLIEGVNMLAIHGLNVSKTSSDFLISAQLVARHRTGPPPVPAESFEYTGPITLTQSMQIKSRVRQDEHPHSKWGALADQIVSVGSVAKSLRISELMYHPGDTGSPLDPNAEYIELTNIGAQAINLNRVQFTAGIEFVFPDVVLLPNEYVLVVKDLEAYASIYDAELAAVVGSYTGSLSNKGERLELVDAEANVIQSLEYDDKWVDLTDGSGFSLTLIDPADPLAVDSVDKDLWRASADVGGSPGWDDSWY